MEHYRFLWVAAVESIPEGKAPGYQEGARSHLQTSWGTVLRGWERVLTQALSLPSDFSASDPPSPCQLMCCEREYKNIPSSVGFWLL